MVLHAEKNTESLPVNTEEISVQQNLQHVELNMLEEKLNKQKYQYSEENYQAIAKKLAHLTTASFYTIEELQKNETFLKIEHISFANKKAEMTIGLGDLMPPSVRKVQVWNRKGKYLGIGVRRGLSGGFYYQNGSGRYAKILRGYSFKVSEVDEKTDERIQKHTQQFDEKHKENFEKHEYENTIYIENTEKNEKKIIYEMSSRYNIDPLFVLAFRKQCHKDGALEDFGIHFPYAETYMERINMFCRKIQHIQDSRSVKNGKFTVHFIQKFLRKYMAPKYKTDEFINGVIGQYGVFIGQTFPRIIKTDIFEKNIKKAQTKPKHKQLSEAKIIEEINRLQTDGAFFGLFDRDASNIDEAIEDARTYLEQEKKNIPVLKTEIEKREKDIEKIQKLKTEYDEIVTLREWKENPHTTIDFTNKNGINLLEFIGQKEGFRAHAYLDQAHVPTIGYGFTSIDGEPVKMGDTLTKKDANKILMEKIKHYQNWRNFVTRDLSPEQEIALTSFEYNLGSGIWKKNALPILTDINEGRYMSALEKIQEYIHYTDRQTHEKKVSQGLINRRKAETKLFMAGMNTASLTLDELIDKEKKAFTALNYALTRRKRNTHKSLEQRIEEQESERKQEIAEMQKKIHDYEFMKELFAQGKKIQEQKEEIRTAQERERKQQEKRKKQQKERLNTPEIKSISEYRKKQKENFYNWNTFYQSAYENERYVDGQNIAIRNETLSNVTNRSRTGWVMFVDKKHNKAYFFKDNVLRYTTTAGNGKKDTEDFSDKIYEGDKRTPLGEYSIDQYNSSTLKQRAFRVSYPKQIHTEQAQKFNKSPGNGIAVHHTAQWKESKIEDGSDFSLGCVHLTHNDMEWALQNIGSGSKIVILPQIDTIEIGQELIATNTILPDETAPSDRV